MSKKKTKLEKATKRHNLSHLQKTSNRTKTLSIEKSTEPVKTDSRLANGIAHLVLKDLRFTTMITIGIVIGVLMLGLIFYNAPLANSLLSRFGIKY